MVELLDKGKLEAARSIPHRYPLDRINEAFACAQTKPDTGTAFIAVRWTRRAERARPARNSLRSRNNDDEYPSAPDDWPRSSTSWAMSLAPQSSISDEDRERGLKLLVVEAAFSSGGTALTSGVILTAFALHLGASNAWVGALASAPFLTQLLTSFAASSASVSQTRKRPATGPS